NTFVSAIRRNDNSIEYFEQKRVESNISGKLKKIPLLRGLVALIQSSANGVKHLEFSSDRFDVDPSEDEKVLQEKETSKIVMILGIGDIVVLSFLFSILIFTITTVFVTNFFHVIISYISW